MGKRSKYRIKRRAIRMFLLFLVAVIVIRSGYKYLKHPERKMEKKSDHFEFIEHRLTLPSLKDEREETKLIMAPILETTKPAQEESQIEAVSHLRSDRVLLKHFSFDYPPFVIPPPLRLAGAPYPKLIDISSYYRLLEEPKSRCSSEICRSPEKYYHQYASWQCQKYMDCDTERTLVMNEMKYLVGAVDVYQNGMVSIHYDCGWPANHDDALQNNPTSMHFNGMVVFLPTPEGMTFQHFIDGCLPKLVQLKPYLDTLKDYQLFLDRIYEMPIVMQLLNRIGINTKKILDKQQYRSYHYIAADELILGCKVPPLHPKLWQDAQSLLQLPWLEKTWHQTTKRIVYLSRSKGDNKASRRVLNEIALINEIQPFVEKKGYSFEVFTKRSSLDDTIEYFANTDVIMGPHGGAFYNMIFMRRNSLVIEFMPDSSKFVSTNRAVHMIVYLQAMLLGNRYYNVMGNTFPGDDMNIDIMSVSNILEHELYCCLLYLYYYIIGLRKYKDRIHLYTSNP